MAYFVIGLFGFLLGVFAGMIFFGILAHAKMDADQNWKNEIPAGPSLL